MIGVCPTSLAAGDGGPGEIPSPLIRWLIVIRSALLGLIVLLVLEGEAAPYSVQADPECSGTTSLTGVV